MDYNERKCSYQQKDCGWAWIISLGSFMVLFVVMAYLRNAGIFFVAIQSKTGDNAQDVAWVSTSFNICMQLFTPAASVFCARFGTRPVVMLGGILMSAGLALSILGESLTFYILTLGVLEGIGAALCVIPSVVILGFHFDRRIALANSIAYSGASIGHMVLAPTLTFLMESYSLNGALLIMSGITLHIVLAGSLFIPIKYDTMEMQEGEIMYANVKKTPNQCKIFKRLLNRPTFFALCIAESFASFVFTAVYKYIPALGQDINVSPDTIALMFSVGSGADLASRMLTGFVNDTNIVKKYIKRYRITALSVGMIAVNAFVLSRTQSETVLCSCIVIHAISSGTLFSTLSVTSLDLLGQELFSLGHSMSAMFGIFIEPMDSLLLGTLRDTTGNFSATFLIIFGVGAISTSSYLIQQCIHKTRCCKIQQTDDEDDGL